MHDINKILEKYPFVQRDSLIPILQDIQDEFGYLSEEAIVKVGKYLRLPTAKIHGLASFYNQFRFIAKGKYHVRVCNGSSCHMNSNLLIISELEDVLGIKNGEVTKNGIFSFEETACMAACGEGPVMSVNETYYTGLTINMVAEIIESYKNMEE